MNQPMGSCHSHFQEVVNLAEELSKYRKLGKRHQSEEQPDLHHEVDNLVATPVLEPLTNEEFDRMEIDSQLELEGGEPGDGPIIEVFEGASKTYGEGTTFLAQFDSDRFANERSENLYYPFASREEWEFASFLLCSSLSMHAIDTLLSSNLVRLEFYWKTRS
jgi:hypothetical protein